MKSVIEAALAAIPPAIRDANERGTHSLYGFKAMFKIDLAVPLVIALLENIAKLTVLPFLLPEPHLFQSPHFACVNRETIHVYKFLTVDPYLACSVSPLAALYVAGTAYIFFCPAFWNYPPHPAELPLTRRCPEVRNNVFLTYPGFEMYNYQSYIILHELVHFYIQHASLTGLSNPPEQYSINGCVGLDALNSLYNPLNFQTYVASKYPAASTGPTLRMLTAGLVVEQGCVQSPDPFLPPWAPEGSPGKPNLPQLNASSPSGFSLSQPNVSSLATLTLPRLNVSLSPGSNIATTNTRGAANLVGAS